LKDFGKSVVVVGDGINDVKSIQIADVGMAMGSGCSAAKEVSDIILMKDDFSASV
jgi:P-type E1-E2 ATPase